MRSIGAAAGSSALVVALDETGGPISRLIDGVHQFIDGDCSPIKEHGRLTTVEVHFDFSHTGVRCERLLNGPLALVTVHAVNLDQD